MSKNKKRVWAIRVNAVGLFFMVDELDVIRWGADKDQSRQKMTDFAFAQGADEVVHDYDLIKYDT